MPKKKLIIIGLLCCFIIILWIFIKQHHRLVHNIEHFHPSAFAKQIMVTRYDNDGNLATKLTTPKVLYFANETVLFLKPKLLIYQENQNPWIVTAHNGKTKKSFNRVTLSGDVSIAQKSGKNNPETHIQSSYLSISPKEKIAETNVFIDLNQRDQHANKLNINAIGMQANQKSGTVNLLSDVNGYFIPHDSDQGGTVTFSVDRLKYNKNTGIGVYTGHAKVKQDQNKLMAEQIISYNDQSFHIVKVLAFGNPAYFETMPKNGQGLVYGTADAIEYLPKEQIAILRGHANVKQGRNSVNSPLIIYNIQNGEVKTMTNAKNERTTIIFEPNQ
ncbi:MAG: LPS export ABC transporter periplasmic protein LptC [Gammaproteobacteria bacterium]